MIEIERKSLAGELLVELSERMEVPASQPVSRIRAGMLRPFDYCRLLYCRLLRV